MPVRIDQERIGMQILLDPRLQLEEGRHGRAIAFTADDSGTGECVERLPVGR
jgi:hypothetical protein